MLYKAKTDTIMKIYQQKITDNKNQVGMKGNEVYRC